MALTSLQPELYIINFGIYAANCRVQLSAIKVPRGDISDKILILIANFQIAPVVIQKL